MGMTRLSRKTRMDQRLIHQILEEEVTLALGCTEPAAIALSAAVAAKAARGCVRSVEVILDPNTFKNASAVPIPRVKNHVGPEIAATLGALKGDPRLKLQVLRNVKSPDVKKAQSLIEEGRVKARLAKKKQGLWIQSKVITQRGRGEAIIAGYHSHVLRIKSNGKVTYQGKPFKSLKDAREKLAHLRIAEIFDLVKSLRKKDQDFLLRGLDVNMAIAREGISKKLGLGVGTFLQGQVSKKMMADDAISEAKMLIAGAADARMGGIDMPVMATAGSGNQGIFITLTLAAVARKHRARRDKVAQALALSHLLTSHVKSFTGRLSAICGCTIAAGIGASAGVVRLLGGSFPEVERAIRNVIGDITGVICDGAKLGCSLKLTTAAESAIRAALLAMEGITIPAGEGIVDSSIDQTIKNLRRISEAMREVDKRFLEILNERKLPVCDDGLRVP
jgi:L-cysteine desulfidase